MAQERAALKRTEQALKEQADQRQQPACKREGRVRTVQKDDRVAFREEALSYSSRPHSHAGQALVRNHLHDHSLGLQARQLCRQ